MVQVIEEQYAWNGSLKIRPKTDLIVLHHAEAFSCTAQDVHRWHLANGWAGIGYHYFVQKDGSIHRGRPRDTVGAHAYGFNFNSVGICAEGNYHPDSEKPFDTKMPAAQWKAILALVVELKHIYPGVRVVGHRDLMATACPGDYYPLEQIKAGIGPEEEEQMEKVTVKVRGKEIQGVLIDGRTHVPIREIIEALTPKVIWDEASKTVIVE